MIVGELRQMLDGVPDEYEVEVDLLVTDQPACPECGENAAFAGGRCFDCRGASMLDPRGDE